MKTDIRIDEHFWQGDNEAIISTWLVEDGDPVEAGQTVAEIMLEKTQMEIDAPVSGTIKLRLPSDTVVRKGDVIASIQG